MSNESMQYDVIIVGAGPAGLAAGIKLKQNTPALRVCILEKGASVGAHILSGAVLEPDSLKRLLPDTWQNAPLDTPVTHDAFLWLTAKYAFRLPTPSPMKNHGNSIISLGHLCRFLSNEAEALGCEIYPGFAATRLLFNENKRGEKTASYQPGMDLFAPCTLFAEGCRGELSQELMRHFNLRATAAPQTYGLGIKEVWRIPEKQHQLGHVVHTIGWPLTQDTYGGSFIYHWSENRVAIGFVVGLDYKNPWLSPFETFQQFKTHPKIKALLNGGERLAYGARALNEGGWQSIPTLTFPGGALIGDAAGFLNVPKIKGIHLAIESGIIAAETYVKHQDLTGFQAQILNSSIGKELYPVRNIRPGFQYGLTMGLINAAFETYITQGHSPWTLSHHQADYQTLKKACDAPKIHYPKPDGKLTFDRLSSVYLTNTFHEEDQPCHLQLTDPKLAISVNYERYASPETRYCPAHVYEIIMKDDKPHLQINAQNCIHCKTCDIKDPKQNIIWKAPTGGGGPNYIDM
jgi:electron-transferring-flavoprotein dehydrogenase